MINLQPQLIATPTPVVAHSNRRTWIILAVIISILILLVIILAIVTFFALKKQNMPVVPPPAPIVEQVPSLPIQPSKYASNAAILNLRDQAKKIMIKLDSVDLIEPEISPPTLDLNIRI